MMDKRPLILIVDDEPFNVDYLEQELEDLAYNTAAATNGQEALDQVAAISPDLILLDVMMPLMNGFEVLARLKGDPATRDIPVIIISAMTDMPSVVKGIQQGAEDYLPKPFDPTLLQARISASLEKKRYRDQEKEYLRQVERLTEAAGAVERNAFEAEHLAPVAAREDALGNLARVFLRMAHEVHEREQRLKHQLAQIRLDMEERQQAAAETIACYLPMDRRHALVNGQALSDHSDGAVLAADVSGFTPLTATMAEELGFQRGAEEITRHLNRVFGALIEKVHDYGGSVIGFSGDGITCWFAGDRGLHAVACALTMQAAMTPFASVNSPAGTRISFAIKVGIVRGPVRRFLVGDPNVQQIEVLAGQTLDDLAQCEHQAEPGEILIQEAIAADFAGQIAVTAWRDNGTGRRYAVITGLTQVVAPAPWPELPVGKLADEAARPWLLPSVYEQVRSGRSHFLSELRPAAALFLGFQGIDYDHDPEANVKLDRFVRWAQATFSRFNGVLLQLTLGDKGSYLYGVFGAPIAHDDDAARAVAAGLALQTPPADLDFLDNIRIGITYGSMRAGAYGGPCHRTYGVMGDSANLAARLMQAASQGVLCDDAVYRQAQSRWHFETLPPIEVKGKTTPVTVYRPNGEKLSVEPLIDALPPGQQLALKVASVIGDIFSFDLLRDIYPVAADRDHLVEHLQALQAIGLITSQQALSPSYTFTDKAIRQAAYNLLLFAQRRQLHSAVAEWYEHRHADLSLHYALLAHHWGKAEDPTRAIHYLEKAGKQARQQGAYREALHYFNQSLALDAQAAVLSSDYFTDESPATAAPDEA